MSIEKVLHRLRTDWYADDDPRALGTPKMRHLEKNATLYAIGELMPEIRAIQKENQRLRDLLFEELHHDHDCHPHHLPDAMPGDGYDAAADLFYTREGAFLPGVARWAQGHERRMKRR